MDRNKTKHSLTCT